MCVIRLSAAASPSMSTILGRIRSRKRRRCQAPVGERCLTPKTWIFQVVTYPPHAACGFALAARHASAKPQASELPVVLRASGEQRTPFSATFLHDVGQIFLPDDLVLLLILDDGALQAGSEVEGAHFAGAE